MNFCYRLHPASNGNSFSESHPEYEGHTHHYVIYHYIIPRTTAQPAGYGGSSALPHPASYTVAPRRTAPSPSNLCPSFLLTLMTIHSSYGCLVFIKDRSDKLKKVRPPLPRPDRPLLRVRGRFSDNAAMPQYIFNTAIDHAPVAIYTGRRHPLPVWPVISVINIRMSTIIT